MVQNISRKVLGSALAIAALAATTSTSAMAAKTIELTAIDGYPARALWVKEFSKFFIPKVND